MKTPISNVLDAQHVKRWSLVATTAESNVASHSFNVAMIAMSIAQRMAWTPFGVMSICYNALMHDIAEVFTGDVPTPTKIAMKQRGVDFNSLFHNHEDSIMDNETLAIVKLADLIDNWYFIREHGSGVRARLAIDEVRGRLDAALDGAYPEMAGAARAVIRELEERNA